VITKQQMKVDEYSITQKLQWKIAMNMWFHQRVLLTVLLIVQSIKLKRLH